MLFHLDTNALSDLMRQEAKILARLAAVSSSNQVRASVVVYAEVLFGIDRLAPGKRQNDLRERARAIFSIVGCEPIRPSAAAAHSRIKCAMEKLGTALGENDLWIGACALDFGPFSSPAIKRSSKLPVW